MQYGIQLQGFDRLAQQWQAFPQIVPQMVSRWLTEMSLFLEGEVKLITPVRDGTLRNSIAATPVQIGADVVSTGVSTSLSYAIPVELGTKPHDIVAKPGKFLAFSVGGQNVFAKKVRHPGTQGYFMFAQTEKTAQPEIQRKFVELLDQIDTALGGLQ